MIYLVAGYDLPLLSTRLLSAERSIFEKFAPWMEAIYDLPSFGWWQFMIYLSPKTYRNIELFSMFLVAICDLPPFCGFNL